MAPVALYKRGTMSDLLLLLSTKERQERWALFQELIAISLFHSQKTSDLIKKPKSEFPTLIIVIQKFNLKFALLRFAIRTSPQGVDVRTLCSVQYIPACLPVHLDIIISSLGGNPATFYPPPNLSLYVSSQHRYRSKLLDWFLKVILKSLLCRHMYLLWDVRVHISFSNMPSV